MIDFACKRFNLEEIIKCALSLTRGECKVFRFFFENPTQIFTTDNISQALSLNLTTVQKAVKKLTEKDILVRHQQNLENGGYIYTYETSPKDKIRRILKDIIKNWAKEVGKEIDKW
ncbi:MAG: MarR family transcriptional regulator [Nanobdellota archaeon]